MIEFFGSLFAAIMALILFFIMSVCSVLYTTATVYVAFKIWGIDIEGFTA